MGRLRSDRMAAYLFILPTAILVGALAVYPLLQALRDSFYRIDLLSRATAYVGLANYARLAVDPNVTDAFGRTVIWVVALTVAFSFYIPVLRAENARRAENQPSRKDMPSLG